jgi:hypothetical protein
VIYARKGKARPIGHEKWFKRLAQEGKGMRNVTEFLIPPLFFPFPFSLFFHEPLLNSVTTSNICDISAPIDCVRVIEFMDTTLISDSLDPCSPLFVIFAHQSVKSLGWCSSSFRSTPELDRGETLVVHSVGWRLLLGSAHVSLGMSPRFLSIADIVGGVFLGGFHLEE